MALQLPFGLNQPCYDGFNLILPLQSFTQLLPGAEHRRYSWGYSRGCVNQCLVEPYSEDLDILRGYGTLGVNHRNSFRLLWGAPLFAQRGLGHLWSCCPVATPLDPPCAAKSSQGHYRIDTAIAGLLFCGLLLGTIFDRIGPFCQGQSDARMTKVRVSLQLPTSFTICLNSGVAIAPNK